MFFGSGFYLDAFFELDTERPDSMNGIKAIPRSKIIEFGMQYGLTFEECEDFLYVIRAMDNEHIKRMNAKAKANNGKKKT